MTTAHPPRAARILVTGGTFDKHYDAIKGELTFKESHLPAILAQSRVTAPVQLQVLQLIDSLHMNEADRLRVLAACRDSSETALLVIHGTDTMQDTARVVGAAAIDKTVVFTGAMVPWSVQGSDALFNLGFAFCAAQLLPAGVWVAMNGRVFAWSEVEKNRAEGVFIANARETESEHPSR
jgi:L-asparaginase